MDRSDVINLMQVHKEQDDYGRWVETYTKKQVFCQVESVSQREFFDAGRNGLNPEYMFVIFFGDYENEPVIEYNGQTYAVYRTYLTKTDKMELYVERKGGTNEVDETPSA